MEGDMTDTKPRGLYAALAAAQAQMGKATKSAANPHFKSKYADLAEVMDACLPALNANGIAVIQPIRTVNDKLCVATVLVHEGGETLECDVPLIVQKNDMQGLGSAITYARRYGLMSMAGIAPEDDDGNAAAQAAPKETIASGALRDAWRDAVEDSLPEDATPRQKAEAYAEAIIADFKSVKKRDTLDGRWGRHEKMIVAFAERQPDLHKQIVEAYENHPAFTE